MLKKVDSQKGDMCMGLGLFLWIVRPGNFASLGNGFNFCFFSPELGRWSNLTSIILVGGLVQPPTRSKTRGRCCTSWVSASSRKNLAFKKEIERARSFGRLKNPTPQHLLRDLFGGFKWPVQGLIKWPPSGWSKGHLEEAGPWNLTAGTGT